MSTEWEKYKGRYSERPETYDAYVDVWKRVPAASEEFSGWPIFTQMASAEPDKWNRYPDRVRKAERFMREGGYEMGAPTKRGARRWTKRRA